MNRERASTAAPPSPSAADSPMTAMHIGEVAQRTELSLRTLRHYDEVGLLRPSGRTDGGFRLYEEADVEKLLLIRRMKPLGFTLDEMADALATITALQSPDKAAVVEAREQLTALMGEAQDRRAKLQRQLAMADEFIALLRREHLT